MSVQLRPENVNPLYPNSRKVVPAQPVDGTPSAINLFSKGGVYGATETGEAFREPTDRHVIPLEGGTVVARDWTSLRQGPRIHSVYVVAARRDCSGRASALAAHSHTGRARGHFSSGRAEPARSECVQSGTVVSIFNNLRKTGHGFDSHHPPQPSAKHPKQASSAAEVVKGRWVSDQEFFPEFLARRDQWQEIDQISIVWHVPADVWVRPVGAP